MAPSPSTQSINVTFTPLPQAEPPPSPGPRGIIAEYHRPPRSVECEGPSNEDSFNDVVLWIFWSFCFIFILWIVMVSSTESPTPVVRLNSLTMSHFNVTNSGLTTNWEADFMVWNPSTMTNFVDGIECSIYSSRRYDSLSTLISSQNFKVAPKEREKLRVMMKGEHEEGFIGDDTLEQIRRDRENGTLNLSMSLKLWVRFENVGFSWYHTLRPYFPSCWDLKVKFDAPQGGGRLIGGHPRKCNELQMMP